MLLQRFKNYCGSRGECLNLDEEIRMGVMFSILLKLCLSFSLYISGSSFKKRIEVAKEKGNLYYLDVLFLHYPTVKYVFLESCFSISNDDVIWRHHFRFGHPSFVILKIMFLSLLRVLMLSIFIVMYENLLNIKRFPFL